MSTIDSYDPLHPSTPFRAAYDATRDEIDAVSDATLMPVNVDVVAAVITVLGSLPAVRALRAQVAADLPRTDLHAFDELERRARALGYAQSLFAAASVPSAPVDALVSELTPMREAFIADVHALSKHGLVDDKLLAQIHGRNGQRHLVEDVMGLVTLLRGCEAVTSGKSHVETIALDRAEDLATRLAVALGERDEGPAVPAEATKTRQRAFTLLVTSYDEVRRSATYLRWHQDDVETIAPSLYAGRGGSKRKTEAQQPAAPAAPASEPAATPPAAMRGGDAFTSR